MSNNIDRYAVFGNPIEHSKSPFIHARFAEQTGQQLIYTAERVDIGDFEHAVARFAENNGKGLNITVPFKREAWQLVDTRSERAARAGAVNTIKIEDSKLYGDNTDGIGLVNDLVRNNNVVLINKRILLMGAGGAARGVLAPLLEQDPALLLIANRTESRARDLAKEFSDLGHVQGCGFDETLTTHQFDVLINATAASLQGELPPLPEGIIADRGTCYDMMYGAEPTPFMQWAERQGATTILDGLGMLVEQAAESFTLWRGVRPETLAVIELLRQEMQTR